MIKFGLYYIKKHPVFSPDVHQAQRNQISTLHFVASCMLGQIVLALSFSRGTQNGTVEHQEVVSDTFKPDILKVKMHLSV